MSKKQQFVFVQPDEMPGIAPRLEKAVGLLTKYYGEVAARGDISFGLVNAKGGQALAMKASPEAISNPQNEILTCRNILRGGGFHI